MYHVIYNLTLIPYWHDISPKTIWRMVEPTNGAVWRTVAWIPYAVWKTALGEDTLDTVWMTATVETLSLQTIVL